MSKNAISASVIAELFASGLHCSQVVLGQWADDLGYDPEELHRAAAAFGGGMFRGDTCGAVTGAMIAIGLKYGGSGEPDKNAATTAKVAAFQERFVERLGSTICRDLLGYDFSVPGDQARAMESGRLMTFCPMAVETALDILDTLMDD